MSDVSEVKVRRGVFGIYDRRGDLVGQVCAGTGRALIGDSFYARERTCQIVVSVDRSPASYGGKVHRCSSCGKALPGALFRNGWRKLDYCPRCGARVTEVVRDGD